jgi:hypothetical protein
LLLNFQNIFFNVEKEANYFPVLLLNSTAVVLSTPLEPRPVLSFLELEVYFDPSTKGQLWETGQRGCAADKITQQNHQRSQT